MQHLLDKLAQICKERPLTEKIIIVPSYFAGSSLLRNFCLKGHSFLNLRAATVTGIAVENLQGTLEKENLQLLPGVLAESKMQEVIQNLADSKRLAYFNRLEITPGVADIILHAVGELKEAGHAPDTDDLPPDNFVSGEKSNDIRQIYAAYGEKLRQEGLLDRTDLLRLFHDNYHDNYEALFSIGAMLLLPSNLRITPLERKILSGMLTCTAWKYLPLSGEIRGAKVPGEYLFERPPEGVAALPRKSLFASACLHDGKDSAAAQKQKDEIPHTDFFHGYGESAEVREIIRCIKREKICFEDVVVYYTAREPYVRLFYEEARRCGIPATFGEGISVSCFRPGRLLLELLKWIQIDYPADVLQRLLAGECFKFPANDGFGKRAVARSLRSSNIGWGRARYLAWMEQVPHEPPQPDEPRKLREHKIAAALKEMLTELLQEIPEPDADGLIDPGQLAAGLSAIVRNRSNIAGDGDARAFAAVTDILDTMAAAPAARAGAEETAARTERAVAELRMARSLPVPGSMHVESYRNGIWTTGKRIFVAGLDARRFPGQGTEDPVLLDRERAALGNLPMQGHRPAENRFEMVQLLAARESDNSRMTLSFSSYDTVENRESSPSSLLLQAYRTVAGTRSAGYGDFMEKLGPPRGIVPARAGESLGEASWWMNRIIREKMIKGMPEKVLQIYPDLKRGLQAKEQRQSPLLTAYDGKINPHHPLWEDGMFLSASKLEQLAKCPYAYILEHMLGIVPPDETVYDPAQWLDALARGTLLHSIFEDFYRELLQRGENPSYHRHIALLEDIARQRIREMKHEVPVPNAPVYEHEYREIIESCHFFLKAEEQNTDPGIPTYLELTFGIRDAVNDGIKGEVPPVKITLPSGRYFYLRGKIDRVDFIPADNSYIALDYKTGGTYGVEKRGAFGGGRQLQHSLYGLALESILKEQGLCDGEPRISACGYYYPTAKGQGQRMMRDYKACLENLYYILDILTNIMDSGCFIMTDNSDKDCTFCDYPAVCNISTFKDVVKKIIEEAEDGPPAQFRAMRNLK